MYTALVLDSESQEKLKNLLTSYKPSKFVTYCHHMTINMGPASNGPAKDMLGEKHKLQAIAISSNEMVCAVKIVTDVPSVNTTKHVTLGVNTKAGGKPVMSNELKNWICIETVELIGTIKEVE